MNASQTDPLTYLDEVDARAEAATGGPWKNHTPNPRTTMVQAVYSEWLDAIPEAQDSEVAGGMSPRDAEFIAHARQDLPALSKALRAVLELHRHVQLPISGSSLGDVTYSVGCEHCTGSAEVATYPCPTVQAIQAALAVNDEGGK
jgi:hypothetical protein